MGHHRRPQSFATLLVEGHNLSVVERSDMTTIFC